MNNSFLAYESIAIALDTPVDISDELGEREGELTLIIDAIRTVAQTKGWGILKDKVFDKLPELLTKEIQTEARKESPDANKLNRLSGQLKWAERYSDLSKLEDSFRLELTHIRKQLYGKT